MSASPAAGPVRVAPLEGVSQVLRNVNGEPPFDRERIPATPFTTGARGALRRSAQFGPAGRQSPREVSVLLTEAELVVDALDMAIARWRPKPASSITRPRATSTGPPERPLSAPAERSEEGSHILRQQVRDLQCGEVAAAWHVGPALDVTATNRADHRSRAEPAARYVKDPRSSPRWSRKRTASIRANPSTYVG
jgi:hypothetical protein